MTSDLEVGSSGTTVRKLQEALNRAGAKLKLDGKFGKRTLAAIQKHLAELTQSRVPGRLVDTIIEHAKLPPKRSSGISTVGAWAGSASLANPQRDVRFCVETNINRLDIVINDHSKWRAPHGFTIRSPDKIRRLVAIAHEAGLEVHLMSWIMPHADYIDEAAQQLVPLCKELGISSVQWDAEEPWMQATQRLSYSAAAQRIKTAFAELSCPMGVNGIGYADVRKLGPLAAVCDYVVPQAYSTASNKQKPSVAPVRFYERWRDKFDRPVVMGLAAYRQRGIPGHTVASAIQAAVDATSSTGIDTVIYWSLRWIRKSPSVADAIRQIRE